MINYKIRINGSSIPSNGGLTFSHEDQSNGKPQRSKDRCCQTKSWVLEEPLNMSFQTWPKKVHSVQVSKAPEQQYELDLPAYDPEPPMHRSTGRKACGE